MTQQQYDLIEAESQTHTTGSRQPTAGLLAWFLHAVWRMDEEDIADAICDGGGDQGIDGIAVDDDLKEITVLQSKHRVVQKSQGDVDLKTLIGAAAYFASAEAVDGLLASRINPELRRLLIRQNIRERVADGAHVTRLVFVTNSDLNRDGRDYVAAVAGQEPPLEVWDRPRLHPVAERTRRPALRADAVTLNASAPPTSVSLAGAAEMVIGLVPAQELVGLPGIADLSVFDRNVRLGVGQTRVNREIVKTIKDRAEHELFPAYHNGLTLLTHGLTVKGTAIELDGVTVVNGCQSLLSLYRNRSSLSQNLRLVVKVVQVEERSALSDLITYRSNNQNPVDIRDQRSTDPVQRDLQAQVSADYGTQLAYAIREGERFAGLEVLDNQTAAQMITAVYLSEPWNAVRKVRLFDQDYHRIFARGIDSHKLFLIFEMRRVIDGVREQLRADLSASFAAVRLTLAHLLAQVLRESERGRDLLAAPQRWLPDELDAVRAELTSLALDIAGSVNFYIEQREESEGETFDAKVVFKSREAVRKLEADVIVMSRRLARQAGNYFFNVEPVR